MADVLSGAFKLALAGAQLIDTLANGETVTRSLSLAFSHTIADGTGASQMDKAWYGSGSIAATTNLDLDVAGGLTLSIFGTNVDVTFAKVKLIVIKNTTATTSLPLLVGPNASGTPLGTHFLGPWNAVNTGVNVIGPSSVFVAANFVDGFPIVAGTTDVLRIRNGNGSAVTYEALIMGTSA